MHHLSNSFQTTVIIENDVTNLNLAESAYHVYFLFTFRIVPGSLARCLLHPLRCNDFARRCASRWTVHTEPHQPLHWHEYKYLVCAEKHPVFLQFLSPPNAPDQKRAEISA
jgi:hypothetical protein